VIKILAVRHLSWVYT